ncbi:MAG: hypothetical protein SF162_07610 [bacterium]|nr:hypothetical protein [bacterium]
MKKLKAFIATLIDADRRRGAHVGALVGVLISVFAFSVGGVFAQTPTPAPAQFNFSGVFDGYVEAANRWITSLSPIFEETGGIGIAIALLLVVGGLIVGAFQLIRTSGRR